MNNTVKITGEILTNANRLTSHKNCTNYFFAFKSNSGVVLVGIDYNLAPAINVGDNVIIKGKLSNFNANDYFESKAYSSFLYIEAECITPNIKSESINSIVIDGIIAKQTIISGTKSLIEINLNLKNNIQKIYAEIYSCKSYNKNVTIEGVLKPTQLDKYGNIEYIINAQKITNKNKNTLVENIHERS